MSRSDLQALVVSSLRDALREAGVSLTVDHRRRLMRVMFRVAGCLAIEGGMPVPLFSAVSLQALADEALTGTPATLAEAHPPASGLN